eukprot:CAMPEP_0118878754 /NCGR_PEP_ID=MMETSP1163-20130328/18653_1 /TAXON_ID=124430 /ORGANISM="Phaeomonas parva, Strain CCMP2877" /LENGTH=466 /DNA_ID=CAMNT_0006814687 /DNA_START=571 /DNA_END=1967 /DNA_ORIENTATION=+
MSSIAFTSPQARRLNLSSCALWLAFCVDALALTLQYTLKRWHVLVNVRVRAPRGGVARRRQVVMALPRAVAHGEREELRQVYAADAQVAVALRALDEGVDEGARERAAPVAARRARAATHVLERADGLLRDLGGRLVGGGHLQLRDGAQPRHLPRRQVLQGVAADLSLDVRSDPTIDGTLRFPGSEAVTDSWLDVRLEGRMRAGFPGSALAASFPGAGVMTTGLDLLRGAPAPGLAVAGLADRAAHDLDEELRLRAHAQHRVDVVADDAVRPGGPHRKEPLVPAEVAAAVRAHGDDVVVLVREVPVDGVVVGHDGVVARVDDERRHLDLVHAQPHLRERVQRRRGQRVDAVVGVLPGRPPIVVAPVRHVDGLLPLRARLVRVDGGGLAHLRVDGLLGHLRQRARVRAPEAALLGAPREPRQQRDVPVVEDVSAAHVAEQELVGLGDDADLLVDFPGGIPSARLDAR